MKTIRLLCLLAVCGLAGCAAPGGTRSIAAAQMAGNARVMLDPGNPRRLTVTLLNQGDFGAVFDAPEARRAFVVNMLADQCGSPTITDTRVTRTGGVLRQYFLAVDCPNNASNPAER